MANFNDPKKKNTSPASFNQIIGEIFQKYSLEENGEQILEKIAKGDLLNANIVLSIARKINSKEVPENQATSLLEAQLKIPRETAGRLLKDIEEKILPSIDEISIKQTEEIKNEIEPILVSPIRPIIGLERKEEIEIEPIIPKIPQRTIKTPPLKPERTKEIKKTSKKSDVYKEPIE